MLKYILKISTEWTKPFVASTSKLLLQQNTWSSHIWCFASNVDNSMSSQQFNVIALTIKFYKSVFIIWKVVLCVLQDWNCRGRPPPRLPRLYVPSVSQYDDSFDTLLRQIILLCNPRELLRWFWLYNYIRWPFLLVMRLSRLIGWFSLYKV